MCIRDSSYTGTSIKSLKYLEINKYGPYISQTEPSFVMDGSAVVTLTADRTTVTGHVTVSYTHLGKPVNPDDFTYHITDDNGLLAWDNEIVPNNLSLIHI